ncbi:MAG TPA: glucose 1-dehydrogenase [Acidimicrobiales bacterium]|nr:glucose 1-dehydrogenase [Acidimicrobiales bacterium]
MRSLNEKVVIVTGASSGIGRAAALRFAQAGAMVVAVDRDATRGPEVVAEIEKIGGRARFVAADVSDDEQVAAAVATAVSTFGGVDVAFNNAGIEGAPTPAHEVERAAWDQMLAVNLTGVWLCMRHEIPEMLRRGGGSIINCASVAGLVGFGGIAPYVAAKHGVVGLSKAAALDYAAQGIRVNAVCPGVIDTDMVQRFVAESPEAESALVAGEPVGRMGRPEEVADAVLWLASERSSFVTGQAIAVDGGYTTW